MSDGLKRIALERVDKAVAALNDVEEPVEGIHDARKRFKEIRSVLRLAREALGSSYTHEKACYREAGRALAASREAQVALKTWEKLCECFPELEAEAEGALVGRRLEALLAALGERATLEAGEARQRLLAVLPVARQRIPAWPLEEVSFEDLAIAIRKAYRRGRRGMCKALGSDDDALWHEWRKRTQDLWHQTRLLRPAWPGRLHAREKQLKRLSALLGEDHDLATLRGLFARETELFDQQGFRARVEARITSQQCQLRGKACRLGRRLWSERPGAYSRGIRAHWDAWRGS